MSECIAWIGAKTGNGYGVLSRNGRQVYAHRAAWSDANGPIPAGMVIAHKCDNPSCYNPDHLFACTQAENLADMRAKNRSASGDRHGSRTQPQRVARGERVGTSKLSAQQVSEIRAAYMPGKPGMPSDTSLTALARRFGVAFQTISKIVNNRSWA